VTKLKGNASAFMLFLMVFFIGANVLVGELIGILRALDVPVAFFGTLWFAIAMQLIGTLLPLFIWLSITGDSFSANMPNQPLGGKNILLITVFSIFVQPAMMLISAFFSQFFVNDAAQLFSHFAAQPWWLMMLAIAVTPGVVEELVFRGYIQSAQKSNAFWKIAVMNGFLFALLHLSPHQFAYTFALGVVFAYLVYFTRSIWAGILSHFIVNGSQVSLAHWAMNFEAVYELDYEMEEAEQMLYDLMGNISPEILAIIGAAFMAVIATPIAVTVFLALRNHNRIRNAQIDAANMKEVNMPEYVAEPDAPEEIDGEPHSFLQRVDWYLVGVVAIYVGFVFLL